MPKYILIQEAEQDKDPWLAHRWSNEFDILNQLTEITIVRGRHFDRHSRDKKFPVKSISNLATGKKTSVRIVELNDSSLFLRRPTKAAKKGAKKAAKKAARK